MEQLRPESIFEKCPVSRFLNICLNFFEYLFGFVQYLIDFVEYSIPPLLIEVQEFEKC